MRNLKLLVKCVKIAWSLPLILLCACWIGVLACQSESASPSDPTLVRVGTRALDREDLGAAAQRMYGKDAQLETLAQGQREQLVAALVAAELLAIEAKKRHIDQEQGVVETLREIERQLLAREYTARAVLADLAVGEEEIAARFAEWGSGEQVRFAHILCASDSEAGDILRALAAGEDFAELAAQHSRHAESMVRGGDMGYLRRSMVMPEILQATWDLPAGTVYDEPIKTAMGYHVVKVLMRRRQTLAEQRASIERQLLNENKRARQEAATQELHREYEFVWHGEIASLMAGRKPLPQVQNLYTWRGGQLSAADYLRRAKIEQPIFADTSRIRQLAAEMVWDDLATLAARARGYDTLQTVQKELEDRHVEVLGKRLFEIEAEALRKALDETALQTFYNAHKMRYKGSPQVDIREILVERATLADSLYQLVASGADMADLARRYSVRGLEDGFWPQVDPGNPRSAKVYRLAMEGSGLLAPEKVPGGHSIIRVIEKRDGQILPFEQVVKAVEGDMLTRHMDDLITRLRTDYTEIIKIDLDR